MSLTLKLVLGFSFALVLQVLQMGISSHYTSKLIRLAQRVSNAVEAKQAAQAALGQIKQVRKQLETLPEAKNKREAIGILKIYWQTLGGQATKTCLICAELGTGNPSQLERQMQTIGADLLAFEQRVETYVSSRKSTDSLQDLSDEAMLVDEGFAEAQETLEQIDIGLRNLTHLEVAREREIQDLPQKAGIAITLLAALLLGIFTAWFSRQLVIPIRRAQAQLEDRVRERTRNLADAVDRLQDEMEQRERIEKERKELQERLVDASRQAGKAEIATGVLHNVGNVLNSVNVSAEMLQQQLSHSRIPKLRNALDLVADQRDDLARFFSEGEKGEALLDYLDRLSTHLESENEEQRQELLTLVTQVDHIKQVVSRQQSYAKTSSCLVECSIQELLEDVLQMHELSFHQEDIHLLREYESLDPMLLDRSRIMQIVMNLVSNAKQALRSVDRDRKEIRVRLSADETMIRIEVHDNGPGIPKENLDRIFAHGFTTKSDGHGFGLHHSANAAKELGGQLTVEDAEQGEGATFCVTLPRQETPKKLSQSAVVASV